jgi:adenylate kinase family enzyme
VEQEAAYPAILLVGPTGSGKTPLGQALEARGLGGRACLHFDFGENLRRVVAQNCVSEAISQQDIVYLRDVLQRNALLEDRDWPIARGILLGFLADRQACPETYIVLNGLPRHRGQARDLEALLDVVQVVHLRCTAQTVLERIAANAGGDRQHRTDDDVAAVHRKLQLFSEQTQPLISHYRQRGARVTAIDVTSDMTPRQMWLLIEQGFVE